MKKGCTVKKNLAFFLLPSLFFPFVVFLSVLIRCLNEEEAVGASRLFDKEPPTDLKDI